MSPPSTSRHHSDWLSLVEVSGPFVSMPVLLRVFPQGLEPRDPTQAKALRVAYDEWQDNSTAPGKHRAWVHYVLTAVLGYPEGQIAEGQALPAELEAKMPEMGETLRPDFAFVGLAGSNTAGQAQLLITSYTAEQALDKPVIGKHWKATPATRMMELLHGAGVPLGLITNGEHWMLIYAPRGETTGYASWYGTLWLDEPITLRAFHSLLGVRRLIGAASDSTLLALFKESAQDQQEVTDQLGYQVREAVEVLVQSFDALDRESNRSLLQGVPETALYEAALTIMMRLVFLFSAEERGLLHLGKPLYDDNYAVSTLQEQLQEVADRYGEEVLERRYDAWSRLLATFRAVHGGIHHQDLLMQAYGGSLFDPDHYPFLERRPSGSTWRSTLAEPLAVNSRVVLHLLNSLQRLRLKAGGGRAAETRRISFRALGVEQIGHVYEGLLDHTAARASEPVVGIKGTRKKEPEIPLSRLESILAQGQEKLIEFLIDETGRSVTSLNRALDEGRQSDEHKLLIACGHDEKLLARLRPFASLIREDSFERPLVVLAGSVYVTAGSNRRSTGTHYTPPSLTEPIVQYTLEPLVYEGPAEGWPRENWKLKTPKAILDLQVCAMAMGSGAFLVQTCRYLAERLVETWENEEKLHPGEVLITPDGDFSEGLPGERLVPADANERLAIARRVVADRCLYGVDINPMAVEMAKLSLWLITVDRDRPFTFLDHAFKCGDSLLGITSLEQLEDFSLRPGGGKQMLFATLDLWRHIKEAKKKREALEAMPSNTSEQISAKMALYAEAEEAVAKLNAAADILVAVELKGLKGRAYEVEREASVDHMVSHWARGGIDLQRYATKLLFGKRSLNWPVVFPEVFGCGGFDALIGNPPFLGSKYWSSAIGDYIVQFSQHILGTNPGRADICALFHRRAISLINADGCTGLIGTESLREGDTKAVGLAKIAAEATIYRAISSFAWPGTANVTACVVWVRKSGFAGQIVLDNTAVPYIDGGLNPVLHSNQPEVLEASKVGAKGCDNSQGEPFILTEENEWFNVLKHANSPFFRQYVTAEDMNGHGFFRNRRWVVHTLDLSMEEVLDKCPTTHRFLFEHVKPLRPPERLKCLPGLDKRWWQFNRPSASLYSAIRTHKTCYVMPVVTKYVLTSEVPSDWVFTNKFIVFPKMRADQLSIFQSVFFRLWVERYSGSLGGTLSVSLKWALNSFPMPSPLLTSELYQSNRLEKLIRTAAKEYKAGYTEVYNRIHTPTDHSQMSTELRDCLSNVDQSVAATYGWQDLDLGQGFHETKQGIRFTLAESARCEVLDRLLALNHRRYAEEVAEGIDEKKKTKASSSQGKRGRKKKDAEKQMTFWNHETANLNGHTLRLITD